MSTEVRNLEWGHEVGEACLGKGNTRRHVMRKQTQRIVGIERSKWGKRGCGGEEGVRERVNQNSGSQ